MGYGGRIIILSYLRSWVSRVADELTSVGKLLAGRRSAGAHAGAARDAHSQSRIPVVAVDAALAVGTAGRILESQL